MELTATQTFATCAAILLLHALAIAVWRAHGGQS